MGVEVSIARILKLLPDHGGRPAAFWPQLVELFDELMESIVERRDLLA